MSVDLSKSEAAYRQLRRDILDARLAPGAALRLDRLRQSHAIGWTPLREALQRLEAERLVVSVPNRGYSVAPISEAELIDLLNTRLVLEEPLLLDAMRHGDEAWEARIIEAEYRLTRRANVLRDPTFDSLTDWDARHRTFHFALVRSAASSWQKRLYGQVLDHLRRHQFHLTIGPFLAARDTGVKPDPGLVARLENATNVAAHHRLMTAVLDRDREAAVNLLKLHVGETLGVYRAAALAP